MKQKQFSKVVATMLIITLTLANFILLGVYATNSYATSDGFETQGTKTNNENVEFDAYFKDEKGKQTHSTKFDFDEQEEKLNLSVQVKKGYLKDAKVQITGKEGSTSNFQIIDSNQTLESIEKIDHKAGTIYLKQLNSGTQIVLELPIHAIKQETFDLSNFSKINEITLTGSYVGNDGKTVEIEKTIQTKNEWVKNVTPVLEQELTKFIPYQIGDKTGTILQTIVRTGLEKNSLPIEETILQVKVPEINGQKPEKVSVTANNTFATNGKEGTSFSNEQWENKEGIITIHAKNEPNNNQVAWAQDKKDEYVITYYFAQKVEAVQAKQEVNLVITAYSASKTQVEKNETFEINQENKLGEMINVNISENEAISKGLLYTNGNKQTTFEEKVVIDIASTEFINKIVMNQPEDNFVDENGNKNLATTSYQSIKIHKENFDKILGEEGKIDIYEKDGTKLATIDHTIKADENGNYSLQFDKPVKEIKIETTKPIANGKLEIFHTKVLTGTSDYEKAQIRTFKTLEEKAQIEAYLGNDQIANQEVKASRQMVDPSTQAEVITSTNQLSTVVTNENVEFRVILKTDDISCDLYKNPTITLELPSYIEKIDVKDINLLFDEELEIADYTISKNENGNTILTIILKGENTNYHQDKLTKGANVVITSDITLKELTPTTEEMLKVTITNENATNDGTQKTKIRAKEAAVPRTYMETPLKAVAPVGIVTTNAIESYNKENTTVTSISGEEKVGKLETKTNSKTATVKMNIINNYENPINQIEILGRIPFEGNKNTTTGEDLKSNLTTTLNGAIRGNNIDASKITIYYSTNKEATKDLQNANNAWKTEVEDFSSIKSYLIVLNDYEMSIGTRLEFSYDITIPENLEHNLASYAIYTVYFNNVKPGENVSENVTATRVGISTGEGAELEANLATKATKLEEGKKEEYVVTIKNVGKVAANNVVINGMATQEGIEYSLEEKKVESILAGETVEVVYTIIPNAIEKEEVLGEKAKLSVKTMIKAENMEKQLETTTIELPVEKGYLNTEMNTGGPEATKDRKEGDKVQFVLRIENVNREVKENVVVTDILPEGLTYTGSSQEVNYDEATRTVTWNIGTIGAYGYKVLVIDTKVDDLSEGQTEKTISNKMKITTKDKELETKTITFKVTKAALNIEQSSETEKEVAVGNVITYCIKVRNTGAAPARNVRIIDSIPEGLKYQEAQYSVEGTTYGTSIGNNQAIITIPALYAGETVDVTIKMVAEELEEGTDKKEVVNTAKISADGVLEITSNEVKHTIVRKPTKPSDPSIEQPEEGTSKISGLVWLDENQDGKRDENETYLQGITVKLRNADNGQIVKDITTGKEKIQQTNEKGNYTFENLKPGNYMVVFEYDTVYYGLTSYQKDGVNDNMNSDVILIEEANGEEIKQVAATDKIALSDKNYENIDMGLVINPQFDLSLNKVITKITVQEGNKVTTHEYKDSKFAKVDLNAKTIKDTSIIIEYKIRVKNEGSVAGYAKKIVDYLPQGMEFSSELNTDWYKSDTNNIYNASLANTLILPGETKELTLLLTKKMNENNLGLINNNAEIYESYNDLGIADIDSTPANKVQSEDDLSKADAMISIKTGEIYIYITITLASVGILAVGMYFIKKKVLGRI